MKYLVLIIITISLMGCNCKKTTTSSDDTESIDGISDPTDAVKATILDQNFIPPKGNAAFEVLEAKVDGDILIIKVTYSGGCEAHDFTAYFNGIYMKSQPPKAGIFIKHDNNGDNCRELITEELKFTLDELKYPGKDSDYTVMIGINNYNEYLEYSY